MAKYSTVYDHKWWQQALLDSGLLTNVCWSFSRVTFINFIMQMLEACSHSSFICVLQLWAINTTILPTMFCNLKWQCKNIPLAVHQLKAMNLLIQQWKLRSGVTNCSCKEITERLLSVIMNHSKGTPKRT